MTAEEMFKELGYKQVGSYVGLMYKKESTERNEIFGEYDKIKYIHFVEKRVSIHVATCFGGKGIANMDELKAINQQCKELGWL